MGSETWIHDRDDISCPNCRDTCYFKYVGTSYGDSAAEVHWRCACCGWWYIEQVSFLPNKEPSESETQITKREQILRIVGRNQYFVFDLLPLDLAIDSHPLATQYSSDFLLAGYISWIRHFQDNLERFRKRQSVELTEYAFEQFSKKHNLGYEFSQEGFLAIRDNGLDNDWKQFSREQGLAEHETAADNALKTLEIHIKQLGKLYPELPLLSLSFSKEHPAWHARQVELHKKYGSFLDHKVLFQGFTGLWFNKLVVNNSPEEQNILRSFAYVEYLNTFHWRPIRSAILIMSDEARCEVCWNKPFALPNGVSDLHIHHKIYKNRGNERFEDLMLVCYECHQKAHIDS